MPSAVASHILVDTEAEAADLKMQLDEGADFEELARKHSQCPSGKAGGSLGQFSRGQMVPEFDEVIFSDLPLGTVSEPVKTDFGHHLIKVQQRLS